MKSLKEKVIRIINEKQMYSLMNNTKWRELQSAVKTLQFPPPYQIKYVHMDTLYPETFDNIPWYYGDWSNEAITPFYSIEWIRVQPVCRYHQGQLIDDGIIDETNEFLSILNKYSIPYEELNGTYFIYGYKR
ncbi:DUF6678 family protein [Clostridium manihotivorum]|uniref:Uncharacterized protein n=1 Tax=Clostridium manihotivorum TaxID=2320868 RepID=A0A3R5QTQ7_9CLOT|nr:DUF6678 family protein [Clostridium manihotivorum]QAA32287.1 hypothetical protein C1I91_11915 [Clostridium manihotivorum]